MMKDTLGTYREKTQSIGNSFDKVESIGIPEALNLVGIPTVSENNIGKTELDSSLSTRFTVFAMGFNVLGLAAVNFGNIPIAGNAMVADLVLASSFACLSFSLFRSLVSKKTGKIKLWLFSKQP
jgi:hypothetical protein